MAIDANIVNFGQSTTTADALSRLGGSVAGAITANKQSGLADSRRQAAALLGQAFSDDSDEAATTQLIAQARELDPEFVLATMQQVKKSQGGDERFSPTTINLPGGISIQTTNQGNKIVTDAGGKVLTGQPAIDAINAAEELKNKRAVQLAGDKSKAKESGKAEGLFESADIIGDAKASIAVAVDTAKKEAKDRGEAFSDLENAKAALPGLVNVVDQLRGLSSVATSTIGGNVFDFAVKESGFGATEGATAKAKFVAIINNQVLPLLKQTFGGAFSVAEGESLKATMGDPDASPEEKLAQLDAFIEGKYREIETKQRLLNSENQSSDKQGTFTSKSGVSFTVEP